MNTLVRILIHVFQDEWALFLTMNCLVFAGITMNSVRAVQRVMMTHMSRSYVIMVIVSVNVEIVVHHQGRVMERRHLCGEVLRWWQHGLPRAAVLGTRFPVMRRILPTSGILYKVSS
jgi:hypothetical protein